jgi:hypothetical protein
MQYLKEVFDAGQNTGLKVLPLSDMGARNVKALKLLGVTKTKTFFRFHNQVTATAYDPTHLLKRTQNLILKHDVQLNSEHLGNKLPVIVKWEHILNLYELDKPKPFLLWDVDI